MIDQGILVRILRNHFDPLGPYFGAEVGVWKGKTSKALLKSFPQLTLFMIDAWDVNLTETMEKKDRNREAVALAQFKAKEIAVAHSPRAIVIRESSKQRAARWSEDFKLCFAFIDACHFYEDVKEDTVWYRHVKEGGLFIVHDYGGVNTKWGVKRAFDEFCDEHHLVLHVQGVFAWVEVGKFEEGEPE